MNQRGVAFYPDNIKIQYRRTVCTTLMLVLFIEHLILSSHLWAQPVHAAQDSPLSDLGRGSSDATVIILQLIILVTTLVGMAYTLYRENRNRKWDLEDREWARRRTDTHFSVVSGKVDDVARKVDENTQITINAGKKD